MKRSAEDILVSEDGWATFRGRRYRCALGRNGLSRDKKEGDGTTPVGRFPLRFVCYRPDRLAAPKTGLETVALGMDDAWSDDSNRPEYNTLVKLPHGGSHEKMWRHDRIYDLVVPIGYNDDPPVPGRGSAVFIHVARQGYPPTDACVAFSLPDLLEILRGCRPETSIHVRPLAKQETRVSARA